MSMPYYNTDALIDNAWQKITNSRNADVISIKDLLFLIEAIESELKFEILNHENKEFLINFIISDSYLTLSKVDFKELFFKLFDIEFDKLVNYKFQEHNRNVNGIRDNMFNDFNANDTINVTSSILQENLINQKANKIDLSPFEEKKNYLLHKIQLLKDMLQKSENATSTNLNYSTQLGINKKLNFLYDQLFKNFENEINACKKNSDLKEANDNLKILLNTQTNLLTEFSNKITKRNKYQKQFNLLKTSLKILVIFFVSSMFLSYFTDFLNYLQDNNTYNFSNMRDINETLFIDDKEFNEFIPSGYKKFSGVLPFLNDNKSLEEFLWLMIDWFNV
ncbi:hypothetical protein B5S33_g1688 [[Candida] boidinii]|nr:hypothetical protein B5S30_g4687 [[Candida] boidinii]OWB83059.1 hypothetical protein B5S33_g1688 [[Candida] boidinii]GMF98059.1 unnamed protein product [[Candida] boidinii]